MSSEGLDQALAVFAKYPEAGRCKTRLIGALGAEGAANLQEQMTRRTLDWSQRLRERSSCTVKVHFAGGSVPQMQQRYGPEFDYIPQPEGDLGRRLRAAVQGQRDAGMRKLVIVGTDCPQLNEQAISQMFRRLKDHDVCIAPARDGGYVAIGLTLPEASRSCAPWLHLFECVDWGTSRVLRQTVDRVGEQGLRLSLMPVYSDVDLPSDLHVWDEAIVAAHAGQNSISVIIPTFGREPLLGRAIGSAQQCAAAEIILVAAGNSEATLEAALSQRVQLLQSPPSRAVQLNLGAQHSSGDALLFLHADTRLPTDYATCIEDCLAESHTAAGAFRLKIDSTRVVCRLVEWGVTARSRWLALPYGDQALFTTRRAFEALGGFSEMPIMEDYEFVRRLARRGKIKLLPSSVTTSARRWDQLGVLRTTLINQVMLAGYHCGVSTKRLAGFYRRHKRSQES